MKYDKIMNSHKSINDKKNLTSNFDRQNLYSNVPQITDKCKIIINLDKSTTSTESFITNIKKINDQSTPKKIICTSNNIKL